jgi:ABC-type uncharacterized transport system substrate-binding protein
VSSLLSSALRRPSCVVGDVATREAADAPLVAQWRSTSAAGRVARGAHDERDDLDAPHADTVDTGRERNVYGVFTPAPPCGPALGPSRRATLDPAMHRLAMSGALLGVLVSLLAAGLVGAIPHGAVAAAQRLTRIGYLAPEPASPFGGIDEFRQWLRELGYVEGQTITIESRFMHGREERAIPLAKELVQLGADVIVARTTVAALAAKQATRTIPIVFTEVGDPVARGLVASIARPGGNLTGLGSFSSVEVNAKRLELLVQAAPGRTRVAVLRYRNPALQELARSSVEVLQDAARALGVTVQIVHVQQPEDLEGAFAAITRERAGAVLLVPATFFDTHRSRLLRLVQKNRLPAMSYEKRFVLEGGLMSYIEYSEGADRRAAALVDRILKGARPGDLPVEQPTRLELLINLKAAKGLGLTIPPALLLQADQVIQ